MKKALIILAAVLFLISGCTVPPAVTEPTATTEGTQAPLPAFLPPPTGYLVTENGKTPLRLGGYTSSVKTGDAIGRTFHADQVIRPLPLGNMETVTIRTDAHLDGIYLYADTGASIPMGAKVALDWQEQPDTVQCRFWPADYKETGTRERTLKCEKDGFTACLGDYIYEFSATWDAYGSEYTGSVNYYVRVIVERGE